MDEDKRPDAPSSSHEADGELAASPDAPPGLAARPGAPAADSVRDQLARLMADTTALLDEHRFAVRFAAVAAVAGEHGRNACIQPSALPLGVLACLNWAHNTKH
jgi:hypothetical protein